MASTAKKALNLAALAEGNMPGLTRACGTSLAEAAAVCLEERQHETGVTFHFTGVQAGSSLWNGLPWMTRPGAATTTFRKPRSVARTELQS